jgi:hypothetical protein
MRPLPALALVLLVGCGGGKATTTTTSTAPSTADPRAACADAIAKAGKTGRGAEPMSADDTARFARIEAAMTDSCVEAQWSPAAISCFASGKTQEELRGCLQLLTPAQNEEVEHRLAGAAQDAEGTPRDRPAP